MTFYHKWFTYKFKQRKIILLLIFQNKFILGELKKNCVLKHKDFCDLSTMLPWKWEITVKWEIFLPRISFLDWKMNMYPFQSWLENYASFSTTPVRKNISILHRFCQLNAPLLMLKSHKNERTVYGLFQWRNLAYLVKSNSGSGTGSQNTKIKVSDMSKTC